MRFLSAYSDKIWIIGYYIWPNCDFQLHSGQNANFIRILTRFGLYLELYLVKNANSIGILTRFGLIGIYLAKFGQISPNFAKFIENPTILEPGCAWGAWCNLLIKSGAKRGAI